jgi:hypothetical protein
MGCQSWAWRLRTNVRNGKRSRYTALLNPATALLIRNLYAAKALALSWNGYPIPNSNSLPAVAQIFDFYLIVERCPWSPWRMAELWKVVFA